MTIDRRLYTDNHAAEIVLTGRVGQIYEPSNGGEACEFEALYCRSCRHSDDRHDDGGCTIPLLAYWLPKTDPDYPKAWIYGPDGQPTCTAFSSVPFFLFGRPRA